MRITLVNPPWSFDGSIYFGCREPHLPLEYGYARALLRAHGHEAEIIDAQLERMDPATLRSRVAELRPEMLVVTTAPSYLFWRCAPPELRVPQETLRALQDIEALRVVVGPHASTTPRTALRKLGVDVAVLGECEEVLLELAETPRSYWPRVSSIAYFDERQFRLQGSSHATELRKLPPLRWERRMLDLHAHHHHRFDARPASPGAEMEASRGCPYHCTFCAKDKFRDRFRKRPMSVIVEELEHLVANGVEYVYFIDEIFVPDGALLDELAKLPLRFGIQMRIDNWTKDMLDRLGHAGCVSIEAGVESLTEEGRSLLAKRCRLSTEELTELLVHAKQSVSFVQANLLESQTDTGEKVQAWRARLKEHGIWANDPVPLFPYPGSPEYTLRFGLLDDMAWERAHEHYLRQFESFSDIQSARPVPLQQLECGFSHHE
jgi:anaerobic magnesium-protoporphyrin IX monomethyl ester cyclase